MSNYIEITCLHDQSTDFDVVSGSLTLSDPCYEKGMAKTKEIGNVLNGKWKGFVEKTHHGRNAELIACHTDYIPEDLDFSSDYFDDEDLADERHTVNVKDGQVSIVDTQYYDDDMQFPTEWKEPRFRCEISRFFGYCCEATLSRNFAGLIPYGCASSSAYGNGDYFAYVYRTKDGFAYLIRIVFFDDYEFENWYEEKYNEGYDFSCIHE